MKTLLLKDLIYQRKWFIAYALYGSLFYLLFVITRESYDLSFVLVLSSLAIGFMILIGSFKADRGETPLFLQSLPISRSSFVHEKFLLLALGTLFGAICTILLGWVFTLPLFGLSLGTLGLIDSVRILTGMMLLSPLLAFYFAFGHLATRYFLFAFMGIGVAVQVVFVIIIGTSTPGRPNPIDMIIEWYTSIPRFTRNMTLFVMALAVFSVSYLVSLMIYRRKDL